jgi:hypothetical protein
MTSINELSSGSKAHNWENDGRVISGVVVKAEKVQQRDTKGNLRTFDDGQPMMQWVLTLDTGNRTADDDGLRSVYAKGGRFEVAKGTGTSSLDAIFAAYRAAGISELEGAKLTVTNSGIGKPTAVGNTPPRLFTATVEKGATPVPTADWADDEAPF